jgi:integrase/recombinase XerD
MTTKKQVRIIKKVRETSGVWRFVSLERINNKYIWDERPGTYFLEWWEGRKRKREVAGQTPSEALEAQRRKRNEVLGAMLTKAQVSNAANAAEEAKATLISEASRMFIGHIKAHSPSKPKTPQRYQQVMNHFERIMKDKKYVEEIQRSDIDDYKLKRSNESSSQHHRTITARTINFEVGTLRTFFYYLINERGFPITNPCARFKHLKDKKKKARSKPPTYSQEELDCLLAACDEKKKAIFATLLLTGIRKRELYFLTWADVDLRAATIRVSGEGKEEFSPKDYEERVIPIPPDLVVILKKLPRNARWVFTNINGGQISHLLRRLKEIADKAKVQNATLHKFRHTYATRLLENGCDIVTLQHLLGHSDIETTRQYLNPHDDLKRQAVNRLSLNNGQPAKEGLKS